MVPCALTTPHVDHTYDVDHPLLGKTLTLHCIGLRGTPAEGANELERQLSRLAEYKNHTVSVRIQVDGVVNGGKGARPLIYAQVKCSDLTGLLRKARYVHGG